MANETVFDGLVREWVADQRVRRPVGEWAGSAVLAGRSPAELVEVANRGTDRAVSEAALNALIRRVGDDPLAALTVLHMLLPAAKGLAGRLRLRIGGDPSERALAVVEALWDRIQTYPWQRRRGSVYGNVLADVVGVLTSSRWPVSVAASLWIDEPAPEWLGANGRGYRYIGWEEYLEVSPSGDGLAAGEELLSLLAEAVNNGKLDREAAGLIGECRVGSVPAEVIGARCGIAAQSVRRRRQRAETQLAAAVAA